VGRRRAAPELIAAAGELAVWRDRERASGRLLRQGEMDASYVDLADARHLEFDYLRRMRDVVELARRHLGLRRAPGLRVRVGDGRALLARRPDGSADAVLVDAFVGARVPRHLVTAEALADLARVAGLAAVNVVDTPAMGDAAAIAAGLRAAFVHVIALGRARVVGKRRGGNVILVGAHALPPLDRLRASAAADRSPGAVLGPGDIDAFIGGAPPWRDAQAMQ